jgi:hypothetical protein
MERPIKKSDRQPKTNAGNDSINPDSSVPLESKQSAPKPAPIKSSGDRTSDRNSERSSDRSSGRGKKSYGEETVQRVSPALARGPKPVKPKPEPEVVPEPEIPSESENSAETETGTSSEVSAE